MNRLGKYCKAYMLEDLRKFSGWNESASETEGHGANGDADAAGETDLSNILFVQENYTVTGGIFLDENVVLDRPTQEWIEFCRDTLGFDPTAIDSSAGNSAQPA